VKIIEKMVAEEASSHLVVLILEVCCQMNSGINHNRTMMEISRKSNQSLAKCKSTFFSQLTNHNSKNYLNFGNDDIDKYY
jgi:hypothetical protein